MADTIAPARRAARAERWRASRLHLRRRHARTRPRIRFLKWSRCFLHSVVIEMECTSIRDCTYSIAPSLIWRAQWRSVRKLRLRSRRLPRRRRSARPRSGNKRNVFGHVIRAGEDHRRDLRARLRRLIMTTEGVGETDIKSLRRPRSFQGADLARPLRTTPAEQPAGWPLTRPFP
jgi:hypothetical protein